MEWWHWFLIGIASGAVLTVITQVVGFILTCFVMVYLFGKENNNVSKH